MSGDACQRRTVVADRPSEQLRRAQELLRVLLRRGRAPADPAAFAVAADLPVGAVSAAVRGQDAEPRLVLPVDGSVPVGADLAVREVAVRSVGASPVLVAELGVGAGTAVQVRELVVTRRGRAVQFRSSSSAGPPEHRPDAQPALVRPVDVEAVRADEHTAQALGLAPGTVVLLQVVLAEGPGGRRLDFAYSRADVVRVETR